MKLQLRTSDFLAFPQRDQYWSRIKNTVLFVINQGMSIVGSSCANRRGIDQTVAARPRGDRRAARRRDTRGDDLDITHFCVHITLLLIGQMKIFANQLLYFRI